MLLSRRFSSIRSIQKLMTNGTPKNNSRQSHHWNYRKGAPPASENLIMIAAVVQGIAWWWMLWHLWTEPGHVFGQFDYPDPSKWTDKELGISPGRIKYD
ncbi:unnamed protein product [Acanthoscelides obtectus]|uniref:NADH dehydrogenase [ubiquinone] 1 beta subcomplex subunit 2, mitochondrial n=1 Tax=Acanthoscelides obtectus TaxID=200917 RepID=A0A9P0PKR1_ACAOB|nr:unnamed protein product [Acanthoscelides obtectus]CAK1661727.1 NADH dehydrogenase [ubiquinone] 1 beta subcomplex subunit 2, mitochondrial [Acanthoscelides obtectus]